MKYILLGILAAFQVLSADTVVKSFEKQMPCSFDSAKDPKGVFITQAFYVFGKEAQTMRGRQLRLEMKVKHISGPAELTAVFRCSTNPGNQLKAARSFPVRVNQMNEWESVSIVFTVPELENIAHFNFQIGFRQNGDVHNFWMIDSLKFVLPERQEKALIVPGASLGAVVLEDREPLKLVENGELKFKIILSGKPDTVAMAAAQELAEHFRLATGKKPEMVSDGTWNGPAIHIGDTAAARKYGVQPERLAPETILLARAGNDIILSGGDRPDLPAGQVISRSGVAVGTLYAVYEFLEKQLGVRWYWPGKLGTVVPEIRNLSVEKLFSTSRPCCDTRKIFYAIPKDPSLTPQEVNFWYRRNRIGGSMGDPIGMHSFNGWPQKYAAAHPEYFALQADGRRKLGTVPAGGHVCMSSPEVLRLTIEEKTAVLNDPKNYSSFSPVMPGDSNGLFYCRCPECQKKIKPERGERGAYSDAVWGFVNQAAAGVAEKAPGKFISCCAYGEYSDKPSFPLLPNVAVTLCYSFPPRACESYRTGWAKLLDNWKTTGAALYVWEYWNESRYGRGVYGAPAVFPRQLKELYALGNGSIRGRAIELSNIDSSGNLINGWTDWMYDVLNLYVGMKLMWDADADVDGILDEYHTDFFGPAAGTVREFHNEMEKAWLRAGYDSGGQWNYQRCWDELYPPPFVDRMMALLRRAVDETKGKEPYASRTKKILEGYLPFEKNSFLFRTPKTRLNTPLLKTPKTAGPPDAEAWKKAAVIDNFCDSYNVYEQKAKTSMRFLHDGVNLHVKIEAAFPEERKFIRWADELGKRDALLWNAESVELFFAGKNGELRQFILAPPGNLADFRYLSKGVKEAMAWNAEGVKFIARKEGPNRWCGELVIPLRELVPNSDGSYMVNFYRNHYYAPAEKEEFKWEQSGWLPVYGGFHNVEKFGRMTLEK